MVWRAVHKAVFVLLLILCGCSLSSEMQGIRVYTVQSDFTYGMDSWEADFTGYPASYQDSLEYQLQAALSDRPSSVGPGKAFMLSGKNMSDDLFMFIKNKITGLSPNKDYALTFGVELASDASSGVDGVNGSPGKSVFLKAGASTIEPKKIVQSETCAFNLDKGTQDGLSGADMVVLGDIAVETEDYSLINRNSSGHTSPFIARTNSNGELWLFVGTDSGYAGITTVYYTNVTVILSEPD
jgi:hypothetical protein